MSKFGSIGFTKGVYVYKHSGMGFSDKIDRVYDLEENEELTFTAKLRINQPTSFMQTYFQDIEGVLKNSSYGLEFMFKRENGVIVPESVKGDQEVTIYELNDGSFICTYKQNYSGEYKRKHIVTTSFHFFKELKLKNDFYRLGNIKVFSKDQMEDFFKKSKLNE